MLNRLRLRSGLGRSGRLIKVLLRHGEAETKGARLWLGGPLVAVALLGIVPARSSVQVHQPQPVGEGIQARALLGDAAAVGRRPRGRTGLARRAPGLVLVLPTVRIFAIVVARGQFLSVLARRVA